MGSFSILALLIGVIAAVTAPKDTLTHKVGTLFIVIGIFALLIALLGAGIQGLASAVRVP